VIADHYNWFAGMGQGLEMALLWIVELEHE
jgi:hypothetical protein